MLEPAAMMCKGEQSKAARELLSKIGDQWSVEIDVRVPNDVEIVTEESRGRFMEG